MEIFIGSSTKHENIAKEIALIIEQCGHTPILWSELFKPADCTLEKILDLLDRVAGGIFVFAPDDKMSSEQGNIYVPRDNVLIEAGVFYGRLGIPCVALCRVANTKVPSDLAGITYIQYEPEKKQSLRVDISDWLDGLAANKTSTVSLSSEMPNFEELVSSAHEEIMISSFFMGVVQTSEALTKAISAGIKVRLVLPDYRGNSLQALSTMLDGLEAGDRRVNLKLKATLQTLATQQEGGYIPSNLEIRFVDYVFPNRITVIDPNSDHGHMYVHISSYMNRTAPKATFHLTKQEYWFNIYKQEFERIWKDARPIDFEDLNAFLAD